MSQEEPSPEHSSTPEEQDDIQQDDGGASFSTEEQDADLTPKKDWTRPILVTVLLLILLGAMGAIGKISGTGWFAYRAMLYERGQLYVLNMDFEPRTVIVDGLEKIEVPAQNAQLVELVGGTSKVVVYDKNDKELTSYDVTIDGSHAILKLTQKKCLAVVDIVPYYGGKNPAKLNVLAKIKKEQHIHVLGSRNIVWPRKPFPSRLKSSLGQGMWVELVGCDLFDDETFLGGYLDFRLKERIAKAMGKKPQ